MDDTETLTVMFVDIVEYTRTTSKLSREEFSTLHDIFDNIVLPIFDRYGGAVVKKIGDAYLVAFKSPTNGVLCGMELQNAFYEYNSTSKSPLRIRVVIHTGEVIKRKHDVYGEAVNVAARMQNITPPNQVFFSEATFSAMNKQEIPFAHLGLKKFRGLKYPVRIFKARSPYEKTFKRKKVTFIAEFIKTLIIVGLIGLTAYISYYILLNYF